MSPRIRSCTESKKFKNAFDDPVWGAESCSVFSDMGSGVGSGVGWGAGVATGVGSGVGGGAGVGVGDGVGAGVCIGVGEGAEVTLVEHEVNINEAASTSNNAGINMIDAFSVRPFVSIDTPQNWHWVSLSILSLYLWKIIHNTSFYNKFCSFHKIPLPNAGVLLG